MNKNTREYYLADWLAGKITDAELRQLVSDEDYRYYLKIRKAMEVKRYLEEPTDALLKKIKQKTRNRTKQVTFWSPYGKSLMATAAAVLLLLGIFRFWQSNSQVLIEVPPGATQTVVLLDGSRVILNARSILKYDKKAWQKERQVYLRGEAFFKVQKGSNFTVSTDNGTVQVLGTQFDVKSRQQLFEVVCYTGKVRVQSDTIKRILTPGKAVRIIDNAVEDWQITSHKPAWLSGESDYYNIALKYVLDDMENRFKVQFDRSGINQNVKFTGAFPNNNLNKALISVLKPLHIDYRIAGHKIILKQGS